MRLFSHDSIARINCGKSYEINPEAASESIDDKQRDSFHTVFSTAATQLSKQNVVRLPTGCKSLDSLLNGGIEIGAITQVYGPPGSGKSQLCHTLSAMLPSDYMVIYIDTEGSFRPERIEAIAKARGLDPKQILEKILVTRAIDGCVQESRIEEACSECKTNNNKIKLLIVDSIIYHFRAEYAGRSKTPERIQRLNKSMHLLLKTAYASGVAVIVTNHQTQSSIDRFDNTVIPLGGNVMSYTSKYRIHLDGRNNNNCRRAILDISPSNPQLDTYFVIDDRGFTDVADDV
jgi:DNA repair protein RadA